MLHRLGPHLSLVHTDVHLLHVLRLKGVVDLEIYFLHECLRKLGEVNKDLVLGQIAILVEVDVLNRLSACDIESSEINPFTIYICELF